MFHEIKVKTLKNVLYFLNFIKQITKQKSIFMPLLKMYK